jgi:hypothetical protein
MRGYWRLGVEDQESVKGAITVVYNNVKLFYKMNPELKLLNESFVSNQQKDEIRGRLVAVNEARSELIKDPLIDDRNKSMLQADLDKDPEELMKEIIDQSKVGTQVRTNQGSRRNAISALVTAYADRAMDSVIERVMDQLNPIEIADEVQSRLANLIDVDEVAKQMEEDVQEKIIAFIVDEISADVETTLQKNITSPVNIENMALEISHQGLDMRERGII